MQSIDFLDIILFNASDFSETGTLSMHIFLQTYKYFFLLTQDELLAPTYLQGNRHRQMHPRTCNTSSKALFEIHKRHLIHRLQNKGYKTTALRPILDTQFSYRTTLLQRTQKNTKIDQSPSTHPATNLTLT